eukprot:3766047-Rhodomonas_salina.6
MKARSQQWQRSSGKTPCMFGKPLFSGAKTRTVAASDVDQHSRARLLSRPSSLCQTVSKDVRVEAGRRGRKTLLHA